ncbi:redoxin domain-containing protein [Variovorax sp. UMC13]|uniref:redoxin domain-containing protein n=1 Tax=Variovorax sp. UMC13 TaxID=1862326 RepID=UPI0016038419|nr:redoxin domain-containing protein [Variovorax sp. UMC13]MBB1603418.1 alkyl hydroperoxide reductase [Variovorax sp. UMC13]
MARNFHPDAPPLQIAQWLNTDTPLTLASLRGRVVVLEAFQMLCPACVTHSLPQASKVRQLFAAKDVAVIGLHTVFEHHDVMGPMALEAFVREYRLGFPIGIDAPSGGSIPATMREYQMQGTPSTVLIDRQGRLRMSHFGVLDDIALGAAIGQLLAEDMPAGPAVQVSNEAAAAREAGIACDALGCRLGEGLSA